MFRDLNTGQTHYVGDGCNPPHPPIVDNPQQNDKKWIEEFSQKFYLINGGHCGKLDFENIISFFIAKKAEWLEDVAKFIEKEINYKASGDKVKDIKYLSKKN